MKLQMDDKNNKYARAHAKKMKLLEIDKHRDHTIELSDLDKEDIERDKKIRERVKFIL